MSRPSMAEMFEAASLKLRAEGNAEAAQTLRPPGGAGGAPKFEDMVAHWRRLIGNSTSHAQNDADPLGDGDQSRIKALRNSAAGNAGQDLIDVWSEGGDFNPMSPPFSFFLSDFIKDVFAGRVGAVRAGIDAARRDGPEALTRLLERRESLLRLAPLHAAIAGSRQGPGANGGGGRDHVGVAVALLEAGARPGAKDVAGYTPLHHCCTSYASAASLAIARHLLRCRGVQVDALNRAGRPAILEPITACRADVVHLLAEEGGADVYLKDGDGIDAMRLSMMIPGLGARLKGPAAAAARMRLANARAVDPAARIPPEPAAAAEGGPELPGTRCMLQGLKAKPQFNGRSVLVGARDGATGRYEAVLEDGAALAVRRDNLLLLLPPPASNGGGGAGGSGPSHASAGGAASSSSAATPAAAPAASAAPGPLTGFVVRLTGLSSAGLNGKQGVAGPLTAETGRYAIHLEEAAPGAVCSASPAHVLAVKPANLQKVSPVPLEFLCDGLSTGFGSAAEALRAQGTAAFVSGEWGDAYQNFKAAAKAVSAAGAASGRDASRAAPQLLTNAAAALFHQAEMLLGGPDNSALQAIVDKCEHAAICSLEDHGGVSAAGGCGCGGCIRARYLIAKAASADARHTLRAIEFFSAVAAALPHDVSVRDELAEFKRAFAERERANGNKSRPASAAPPAPAAAAVAAWGAAEEEAVAAMSEKKKEQRTARLAAALAAGAGGPGLARVDDLGRSLLHHAVRMQRRGVVSTLLSAGAKPDLLNAKGFSALHTACGSKDATDADIVQMLLAGGANVNLRSSDGRTPLLLAAAAERPAAIALLAAAGADLDASFDGKSALYIAKDEATRAALLAAQTSRAKRMGRATRACDGCGADSGAGGEGGAPAAPAGATPRPLLDCSRCRAVAYCSPACQQQAWKTHKAACVQPVLLHLRENPDLAPGLVGCSVSMESMRPDRPPSQRAAGAGSSAEAPAAAKRPRRLVFKVQRPLAAGERSPALLIARNPAPLPPPPPGTLLIYDVGRELQFFVPVTDPAHGPLMTLMLREGVAMRAGVTLPAKVYVWGQLQGDGSALLYPGRAAVAEAW